MFQWEKYREYVARKFLDTYSAVSWQAYYQAELRDMLLYCSKRIPFYRHKGDDIRNYDIIDKDTVDLYINEMRRPALFKNIGYTSGTTGAPRRYYRSLRSIAAEQYFQEQYFGWQGKYLIVLRGDKFISTHDKPDKIYIDLPLMRTMYISSYHMNETTVADTVDRLKKIRDKVLWAYPSTAALLAKYCLKNSVGLFFDFVATSSEQLFNHQIEEIEKAFACNVKDWYGQGERVAAFYRCDYGHYHEVNGYSYVEYLPVESNVYEVVGTTLHNTVMPLVRYNSGDRVEMSDEPCPCGCEGPNIVTIHGRDCDYLDLPSGRVPGTIMNVMFKKVRNIREAQAIQQKKDKKIVLKVVQDEHFDSRDNELLLKWIGEFFPGDMCSVTYVDSIEKSRNGKYRFVINENTGKG